MVRIAWLELAVAVGICSTEPEEAVWGAWGGAMAGEWLCPICVARFPLEVGRELSRVIVSVMVGWAIHLP